MKLSEISELAFKEAENINKYASDEEKNKLEVELVHSNNVEECIYGLMTGHCHSSRALELINKCTNGFNKFFHNMDDIDSDRDNIKFHNGIIKYRNFSPLEIYIYQNKSGIEKVIEIIKK